MPKTKMVINVNICCSSCGKQEIENKSRQLCNACYLRLKRAGIIKPFDTKRYTERVNCKTLNCTNLATIKAKSGLCRECMLKSVRKRETFEHRKNRHLRETYNISLENYIDRLRYQEQMCAICKQKETRGGKMLAVDHNKETGQIRGLLCSDCNIGIGKFDHNVQLLRQVKEYLQKVEGA